MINADESKSANPGRTSWPYIATPIAIYLMVMFPICALESVLFVTGATAWMKWSAGGVLALTAAGLVAGYARRLVLTPQAALLIAPWRRISIDWSKVRKIGTYVPGGGVGATQYLFVTTREAAPMGKWDIDSETIQVQYRAGLLDEVRAYFAKTVAYSSTPVEVS